jgi:hypothetical protein
MHFSICVFQAIRLALTSMDDVEGMFGRSSETGLVPIGATAMLMHWPEVSKEQYEQARKEVNFEGETPQGVKLQCLPNRIS